MILSLMKHMGAHVEDAANPQPSAQPPQSKASKSVNNPKGERIERGTSSKSKRDAKGTGSSKDAGKAKQIMEQVRVSPRLTRQSVHSVEKRVKPIVLPTVITRNETGQEMETSTVIYPGSMPSTGKSSTSSQSTDSQSNLVEVRVLTKAKILEVANSNIYHDGAFLEFLKTSKAKVKGDTQEYLSSMKREILFFTVGKGNPMKQTSKK